MKRKAKTGPPVVRRGGKRVEVYIRPAEMVRQIEEQCRKAGQGRQEFLLRLIRSGLETKRCE